MKCTCKIQWNKINLEPVPTAYIEQCPLCKAAPELYAALVRSWNLLLLVPALYMPAELDSDGDALLLEVIDAGRAALDMVKP